MGEGGQRVGREMGEQCTNSDFASLTLAMVGPRQAQRLQNMSVCTPAWAYCHNIPDPTALGGHNRVIKATRNAEKIAETA